MKTFFLIAVLAIALVVPSSGYVVGGAVGIAPYGAVGHINGGYVSPVGVLPGTVGVGTPVGVLPGYYPGVNAGVILRKSGLGESNSEELPFKEWGQ